MALDWHIQGLDGEPEAEGPWVPMGEVAHAALFSHAERPLPLLARMADYYGEAAYAPGEVPELLAELAAVAPRAETAADVLAALAALCEEAARRGRGVLAIGD